MSTLKDKAQNILDEKELKILPENIKNGVEIFNVIGTYEGESDYNAKMNTEPYGAEVGYNGSAILRRITSLPYIDTSEVLNFSGWFSGLYSIPRLPDIDMSNGKAFESMFIDCQALEELPSTFETTNLDITMSSSMSSMFAFCTKLVTIPNFNTTGITSMRGMFMGCHSLVNLPNIDTSSNTDFWNFLYECRSMINAPSYNTSSGKSFGCMFYDCSSLVNVPIYDVSSVENNSDSFSNMFYNCPNLSNESLNNIMQMCINATNITIPDYMSLSFLGLTNEQAQICTTLSNYQDFINAGWTTGY